MSQREYEAYIAFIVRFAHGFGPLCVDLPLDQIHACALFFERWGILARARLS